jgi:hypothetical protein
MSQRLSRVREAAKQRKKERFTALFHLLTAEALENAFLSLSRKAAAGVDGIRWKDYAENLKVNIADLHRRLHQGVTGLSPAGTTSRKRMENSARSASPHWRTKSSSMRWLRS